MVDNNLNESPKSELFIKLEENEEALQNLNFQKSMQQLEDLSQIRKIKKEIARIKTIIHQYESNIKTEGNNQTLVGKVVSSKMDSTVSVLVTRVISHPVYKKRIKKYKKYLSNVSTVLPKEGDIVKIVSTKPISKNKRWQVSEILQESKVLG